MKAHMNLILSTVFFASSIICMNQLVRVVPTFTLNSSRFIIGGLFLWIIGRGLPFKQLTKKDWFYSFFRGVTGVGLYYWLETEALLFITPAMVSILVSLCFLLDLTYSLLKREIRLTARLIGVIALIGVGIISVSYPEVIYKTQAEIMIGIGLMSLASISWVIYVRLEHTKPKSISTIQIVSLDMLLGGIALLPMGMIEESIKWQQIGWMQIGAFIYLAIVPTALAYYFYNKASKLLKSTICSLYMNLIPALSVVISGILIGNAYNRLQWIGICSTVMAVIAMQSKSIRGIE